MAKLIIPVLLVLSMTVYASDLKFGIYVPSNQELNCAYIVTDRTYDDGVVITFIHDPRKLPELSCPTNGFDNYPIGVEVLSNTSFKDIRTMEKFNYFGF